MASGKTPDVQKHVLTHEALTLEALAVRRRQRQDWLFVCFSL